MCANETPHRTQTTLEPTIRMPRDVSRWSKILSKMKRSCSWKRCYGSGGFVCMIDFAFLLGKDGKETKADFFLIIVKWNINLLIQEEVIFIQDIWKSKFAGSVNPNLIFLFGWMENAYEKIISDIFSVSRRYGTYCLAICIRQVCTVFSFFDLSSAYLRLIGAIHIHTI